MRTLFAHFDQGASLRSQFVLHRGDLYLFVQGGLSDQVFLINFWYRLRPDQGLNLRLILPLGAINTELFSFLFMVEVGLLLVLKGLPFLVDFPLCEYTRLDVNLSDRWQVHIHSIVSFRLLILLELRLLLPRPVHCVV